MTALYLILALVGSLASALTLAFNYGAYSMGRKQPFLTLVLVVAAIPAMAIWDILAAIFGEETIQELWARWVEVYHLMGDLVVETMRSDYE